MIYFFILLGVIYLFWGVIFTNYFTVIFLPDEIFYVLVLAQEKKMGFYQHYVILPPHWLKNSQLSQKLIV